MNLCSVCFIENDIFRFGKCHIIRSKIALEEVKLIRTIGENYMEKYESGFVYYNGDIRFCADETLENVIVEQNGTAIKMTREQVVGTLVIIRELISKRKNRRIIHPFLH